MSKVVLVSYPHRRDVNGLPETRVVFVASTENPSNKPKSLKKWQAAVKAERQRVQFKLDQSL